MLDRPREPIDRPLDHWARRPRMFEAYSKRLGIDWRGAVVFQNKIVAEGEGGSLWLLSNLRTGRRRWIPLVALDIHYTLVPKAVVKNGGPKRNRADEQRKGGERGSLSGNVAEHSGTPV